MVVLQLWGNIFLSMASLVICMQLRHLFSEGQRRLRRHKNYKRVIQHMHDKLVFTRLLYVLFLITAMT